MAVVGLALLVGKLSALGGDARCGSGLAFGLGADKV